MGAEIGERDLEEFRKAPNGVSGWGSVEVLSASPTEDYKTRLVIKPAKSKV